MNAEPPIFELWKFEQWYLKYHRYVGGLELQTTVWLGEHELNCLTCVSSDSHFPTQESCTTHEFQSTPDDWMLSSLYLTSNPSIPSWPVLLLLTLLFVCPWLWMKLLNWCCFCHSGHKCHLEIYTIFENNCSAFIKAIILFFSFFQNHACTCTGNWILREFHLHDFGYI